MRNVLWRCLPCQQRLEIQVEVLKDQPMAMREAMLDPEEPPAVLGLTRSEKIVFHALMMKMGLVSKERPMGLLYGARAANILIPKS